MTPSITLVRDNIGPTLTRYADVMGRTLADTVKRAAKGVTRRVIALTPPGSEGVTGAAAYRQGRKKIERQMHAVLAPVRLKGKRRITQAFGRTLGRAVIVPTRELHPDVRSIYRDHTRARGVGTGISTGRVRQKKYVDVRKFKALLADKQGRVGLLASGFAAAARVLDVPLQQWIKRHGGARGAVKLDLLSSQMRIVVINFAPNTTPAVRAETSRRIGYALQYQMNSMRREIDYMAMKKAQELAIKTRNFAPLVPAGMFGSEAA